MSNITRQQQADLAVDACNTCAFTVNLSTNSLIHHFRYNSRPSENRFQTASSSCISQGNVCFRQNGRSLVVVLVEYFGFLEQLAVVAALLLKPVGLFR